MDSDIPLHIDIPSIRTRNATMLQPPSAKANTNSQASFIHFPENRELSCRVSTPDGFFLKIYILLDSRICLCDIRIEKGEKETSIVAAPIPEHSVAP